MFKKSPSMEGDLGGVILDIINQYVYVSKNKKFFISI